MRYIRLNIIYLILILFVGCSNRSEHTKDLNNPSISKITFNLENKNVSSIEYQLKTKLDVQHKYLYLKGGQRKIDIVINSTDTIKYDDIQLVKKPYSKALLLKEKQLDFKLIQLSKDTLYSVQIILHKKAPKKFTRIKHALIIDENGFNQLFKKAAPIKSINFPLIDIKTSNTIYDIKQKASFTLFENPLDTSKLVKSSCTIKIRGNTSKSFKKKGFKIKLTDTINTNRKLLGMPAEHDWVLHGPIKDISLFRNKFAYDLARSIDYYAPRCEFCELIVNNEYLGIYALTENIKRDRNRVNITKNKLDKDKLDSYIIKLDRGYDILFASYFKSQIDSGWKQYFNPVYPKAEQLSSSKRKQLKEDIRQFELSLIENSSLNQINMQSFIDYFIISELTKNIDAYRLSTFMHKNIGNPVSLGPIWDFNYSLGLNKEHDGHKHEGWVYQGEAVPFWWDKLVENHEFKKQLNQRWFELRKDELSLNSMHQSIDQYVFVLEPALERNFYRWDVFDSDLWVRKHKVSDYPEEVELIKQWIEDRVSWIDEQLEQTDIKPPQT